MITDYAVTGMTCQHCVDAVTSEVRALPGVGDVQVVLATGRLRVSSATVIDFGQIEAAVDEAGYTVRALEPGS